MNLIDEDLIAVRAIPPGSPTPSDESVSRAWHALIRMQAAQRRRSPLRRLAPALAGLVVVLVAISTVVFIGQNENYTAAQPNISTVTATHQESSTQVSTRDSRLRVSTPEAIAALNALADTALSRPGTGAVINAGQYVYVEVNGWAGNQVGSSAMRLEFQPRDGWYDPQGMTPMKLLDGERDMFAGPRADREGNLAHAREAMERLGPGIQRPTPQWLAALPTDPTALLAQVRAGVEDNESWSPDYYLWDMLGQFYSTTDVLLTPQLRAALLRSFTQLDGLTVGEVKEDDRILVALRSTQGDRADEILFDPQTGNAVGRRSLYFGPELVIEQPVSGPVFTPPVAYHATWYQAVVDSLDDRN